METEEKSLKELIDDLRQEWKFMWRSRIDDKVRAEGIADKTYDRLFVDRGTILFATRKYKPLEFRDIIEKYLTPYDAERFNPDPFRGGIRKFIRDYITSQKSSKKRFRREIFAVEEEKKRIRAKHGGGGWLHLSIY